MVAGTLVLLNPTKNYATVVSLGAPWLSSSETSMGNGDTHMYRLQGEGQPGHSSHSGGW